MNALPMQEIAKAMDGISCHSINTLVQGVSIDSRTIKPGDLFFAIRGDFFDGHKFVADTLLSKNAAGAVVDMDFPDELKGCIRVPDTVKALQKLGGYYRQKFNLPIIAVTGSHGKTSTKDILTSILKQHNSVCSTHQNLNGLLGVPLTLLNLNHDHDFAVIEIGISKPGEMDVLASIVQPSVAIFTCVAPAHTEFLHSKKKIAHEKSKIFDHLPANGLRVLNAEDTIVMQFFTPDTTITFGMNEGHYRAKILENRLDRLRFNAKSTSQNWMGEFCLPIPGKHNVLNALAAIAACREFEISNETIQAGISNLAVSPHRTAISQHSGITIIDDSYNAAPLSMLKSIEMLAEFPVPGKKIAVIGDMKELGTQSKKIHFDTGQSISHLEINLLMTFGEDSFWINKAARSRGKKAIHFSSKTSLIEELLTIVVPGDAILVKASRSMHGEEIVDELINKLGLKTY